MKDNSPRYPLAECPLWDYIIEDKPSQIVLLGSPPIDVQENTSAVPVVRLDHIDDWAVFARAKTSSFPTLSNDQNYAGDSMARAVIILTVGSDSCAPFVDNVLGWALRRNPRKVLAHCSDSQTNDSRFYAFGFRQLRLGRQLETTVRERWYEYRLSEYKRAPDWLNARFWANPERFDEVDSDEYDAYESDDNDDEEE